MLLILTTGGSGAVSLWLCQLYCIVQNVLFEIFHKKRKQDLRDESTVKSILQNYAVLNVSDQSGWVADGLILAQSYVQWCLCVPICHGLVKKSSWTNTEVGTGAKLALWWGILKASTVMIYWRYDPGDINRSETWDQRCWTFVSAPVCNYTAQVGDWVMKIQGLHLFVLL